jgi:hypothetical protein
MRFVKQRKQHDCSFIAILNILKWAGYKKTLKKDLPEIRERCELEGEHGAWPVNVLKELKRYDKIKVIHRKKYSCETVKTHLRNGGALVLFHHIIYIKEIAPKNHCSVWLGYDQTHIKEYLEDEDRDNDWSDLAVIAINMDTQSVSLKHYWYLNCLITQSAYDEYPVLFFVYKK